MSIVFNADEILAIAERIERNGAAFYRAAAAKNRNAAELLERLAAQEDAHLATFSAMRRQLAEADKKETTYDPDGQAALYIQAMADRRVFNMDENSDSTLDGNESLGEIIGVAIGKEKDSVVFYTGMKAVVPPALGAARVEEIIAEEMRHIAWLRDAYDKFCPSRR